MKNFVFKFNVGALIKTKEHIAASIEDAMQILVDDLGRAPKKGSWEEKDFDAIKNLITKGEENE